MQNNSQCNSNPTVIDEVNLSVGSVAVTGDAIGICYDGSVAVKAKIEDSEKYQKGFLDAMTIQNRKIAALKKELTETRNTVKLYITVANNLTRAESNDASPSVIRHEKEALSKASEQLWEIVKKC